MKTLFLGSVAAAALATAGIAQDDIMLPAGAYTLDNQHASVTWRINHLGTSMYTARFNDFDIDLNLDPDDPAASSVSATIDVTSLDLDYDGPGDFYTELMGNPTEENEEGDQRFFRAPQFPTITFESTGVEVTGENTATVTGDLTMLGQTHPLTLDVTFNGKRAGFGPDAPTVVGFSATASVPRADWGMDVYSGALGDNVEVWIESEFMAPAE